jgi:EAL domain-containing protein (putative c-di-GMP-specific phosphodiesterase class I)
MRFHTEKYGMVSPVEFVPILEETGLIIPAGRWIMQQALEACKKIQYILPGFHISINVSYIQVMKGDIINELTDAVSSLEIPPSSVIVELTDSGEMPTDSRFSKLWELLKESGILIPIFIRCMTCALILSKLTISSLQKRCRMITILHFCLL